MRLVSLAVATVSVFIFLGVELPHDVSNEWIDNFVQIVNLCATAVEAPLAPLEPKATSVAVVAIHNANLDIIFIFIRTSLIKKVKITLTQAKHLCNSTFQILILSLLSSYNVVDRLDFFVINNNYKKPFIL